MKLKFVLGSACVFAATLMAAPRVHADTLEMHGDAAQGRYGDVPRRGMTMAQVERRFGAPAEKLPTRGGDAPKHPPIHRWRYNGYTVYFERNRVIHSVLDADAGAAPNS